MTHFIVKHANGEFRYHADDGAEPVEAAWVERPTVGDIADEIAEAAPGSSLWGEQAMRAAMVDLLSEDFRYRDLTVSDETVPWQ